MDQVKKKMGTLKLKLLAAEKDADEAEAELQVLNSKTESIEQENQAVYDQIGEMEDKLDATESTLSANQSKLVDSEKSAEESLHEKKIYENRSKADKSKVDKLSEDYDSVSEAGLAVKETLEKILEQSITLEEQLDVEDVRCVDSDVRVKELEVEVTNVGNTMRAMETAEESSSQRSMKGQKEVEIVSEKLKSVEEKATVHEAEAATLEEELDKKEHDLAEVKERHAQWQIDFNNSVNEINEL